MQSVERIAGSNWHSPPSGERQVSPTSNVHEEGVTGGSDEGEEEGGNSVSVTGGRVGAAVGLQLQVSIEQLPPLPPVGHKFPPFPPVGEGLLPFPPVGEGLLPFPPVGHELLPPFPPVGEGLPFPPVGEGLPFPPVGEGLPFPPLDHGLPPPEPPPLEPPPLEPPPLEPPPVGHKLPRIRLPPL